MPVATAPVHRSPLGAALRRRDLTGFGIANTIFLLLLCFIMLYPFWNTLVRSLSANSAILSGRVYLWPVGLNLEGYQTLFRDALFFVSLRNTLFTTTVGTAIRLAVTLLAGYAFSKNNLVGRKALFLVFLLTMFFEGGIVPTFIIVRNLGLYDTLWALVLIEAAKVFYMILAMSFLDKYRSRSRSRRSLTGPATRWCSCASCCRCRRP